MLGIVKIIFIANSYRIVYMPFMPTEKPKIIFVMEENLLKRVDDYRFENRINSRSEAIRRLIEEGLKVSDPARPKAKKN